MGSKGIMFCLPEGQRGDDTGSYFFSCCDTAGTPSGGKKLQSFCRSAWKSIRSGATARSRNSVFLLEHHSFPISFSFVVIRGGGIASALALALAAMRATKLVDLDVALIAIPRAPAHSSLPPVGEGGRGIQWVGQ